MKRNFHLFLFCVLNCSISAAQPSQAELEAMQKKIQQKMDSIMNDPRLKKYKDKMNTDTGGMTPAANIPNSPSTNQGSDKDLDKLKLPPRDSAKINSIPKKNFSPQEINSYLADLHAMLAKKLPVDAVNSANSIAVKLGNDPLKLEAAALHAFENGSTEESLLLITRSGSASTDGLILTNTGAILDMGGLSEKAIPVLRTVVTYAPQNSIALNNLGQAFTALGMQDSAMYYFSRCLSLSPKNPEANNTAGVIELKKGNKAGAQAYFENSIRGSLNISAYNGLKSILKDKCRIAEFIKPKVKMAEYFNQFKYKIPPQCLNVNEATTRQQEFDAFKKMLNVVMQGFRKIGKEAEQKMAAKIPEMNKTLMEKAMKGEKVLKPFQMLGSIMEAETILEYRKDKTDLEKFNKENREQYNDLEKEYRNAYEQLMKSGGGDLCPKEIELKNSYLSRFAQLNEEWQSRNMLVENKYIDDLLFWCYFSAVDTDDYRGRFYNWAYNYLYTVNFLAQVKILEPCKEHDAEEIEQPVPAELKEFDCPVDIQIPFIVGKLTVNCEKFSFKAGELIVFKYEKKFTGNRQSTIAIGGGVSIDATAKGGPLKAGIEAGMDMSIYFTFDKQGNCVDGGTAYKAYAGGGVDFSAGERIKVKGNLGYVGTEAGVRFGLISGVSFTEPGFLKEKPEKQLNKNVKPYKPN